MADKKDIPIQSRSAVSRRHFEL